MGDNYKEDMQCFVKMVEEQFDREVEDDIERIKRQNKEENLKRYGCPDCDLAKCYTTCPRYLTNCEPEELFRWWGRTSPPCRLEKDYIQQIEAPPAKKGGSKSGKKRKEPSKFYTNPYISG